MTRYAVCRHYVCATLLTQSATHTCVSRGCPRRPCMVCKILTTSSLPPKAFLTRSQSAWNDSTGWQPHMKPGRNALSNPSHALLNRNFCRLRLRIGMCQARSCALPTSSTYLSSVGGKRVRIYLDIPISRYPNIPISQYSDIHMLGY
jgi:hypothetical protein